MCSLFTVYGFGQTVFLYEPEGLNIPGSYDDFRNPPANPAFASSTSAGGDVTKIITGTVRWQTTVQVATSGGDVEGGTYGFLFTSGPDGDFFRNKWAGTTVTMNTLQRYAWNSGANNSITYTNGNWYTMNWKDNGYADTEAIFMETSADPIDISDIEVGTVSSDNFMVNITLSGAKSPEERIYIRYSSDGFSTSKHVEATGSGTAYSAMVSTTPGTVTRFYGLSTTVDFGADHTAYDGDYDMATINFNNNGGSNFTDTGNRGNIDFIFSSETTFDDNLHIVFREGATLDFDVDDAGKIRPLLSEYAIMAFKSNGALKSKESLPWDLTEAVTVAMEKTLVGVSDGIFTLSWKGLESIPAGLRLTFHDYETGMNSNMHSVSEYTFDVVTPAGSATNSNRFAITIAPSDEGLNIPGSYDDFRNPPANPAFASSTSAGGDVTKIITGTVRWQTAVQVATSGGDVEGGTYGFLFTSGPAGDFFRNKWAGTTVTMNTLQRYAWNSGANNSITYTNGNWYTMNWKDNGYADTEAIFMETSADPIDISDIEVGTVSSDNFMVNITLSGAKSPEERIYIRYSSDGFSTSKHVEATGSGTAYSAMVSTTPGTVTRFYGLSTTVDFGADHTAYDGDYDMATINFNNNRGSNFTDGFIVQVTGDAGWRLLSLPKTGGTVADIADDTAVQGVPDGNNATAAPNFIIYDHTGAWGPPLNVSTSWGDGYGFALYFYDNTVAGSTALPLTLDATGVEPSSDVTVALNATVPISGSDSYFTLVGNPFGSNFDASTITQTGDAIQNNIHFWDNEMDTYSAKDKTGTEGYIVSPWQGFWVEVLASNASATTAVTLPTSGKTDASATGTFFSKQATNRGDIAFALSSQTTYDEALRLSFREVATRGHDVHDANKLTPLLSEYATMAFNSNGVLKSVESLPWELTEEITVPMEENLVGVSGSFTLTWKGLESVPAAWGLTFHDYDTGINSDMRSVSEYTFDVASLAKAKVNPLSILTGPAAVVQKSKTTGTRFAITITPPTSGTEGEDKASVFALEQNYPNPFNPSTVINYSVANSGKVSLSVYNLLGQKVAQLVNGTKAAGSYNVTWNATAVASGMYYYRLETGGKTLIRKMMLIK